MSWRMNKSSSLGMPTHPKEISKRFKRQSLGMPLRHPFFIGKNQVTFQDTIFLLLHALCVFLGALVVFSFQFSLVLLAAINGSSCCFGERLTPFFIAKNTLVFTLIVQRVFSFSTTAFSFCFHLDFHSDLVLSLFQGVFGPLVYVGFHQKSCFKKVQMVLEKRKFSCKKVVQKRAYLDCGLGFCMLCLMSF
jgi:hypothetical protein